MLALKVTCEKCNIVFDVSGNNIKETTVQILEDEKMLDITYYDCPECGKRHVVQLDDENTKVLLSNVKTQMRDATKKKRQNKIIGRRSAQKFEQLRADLRKMRSSLVIQYSGKHYMTERGQEAITVSI